MNKGQENKLTMYEGVATFLSEYKAITDAVSALPNVISRFQTTVQEIKRKSTVKLTLAAGKTASKSVAKKQVIEAITPIMAALGVFAVNQQNVELQNKTKAAKSNLAYLRDTEFVTAANSFYQVAEQYKTELTGYGIAATKFQDLQARIDVYQTALSSKESAVAKRTTATESIAGLFRQADTLLRVELDPLISVLKAEHPEFCSAYNNARGVKNLGRRKRQPAESPTPTGIDGSGA